METSMERDERMPGREVAIVTGASRGIGRAIATRLAADGVAVAVSSATSHDEGVAVVEAIRAAGGSAVYHAADVRVRSAVNALVGAARDQLGPVSILVHNAGWIIPQPFEDDTEEHWDRILDTKIKGCLYLVSAALPDLKARQWGKIIAITGDAGRVGLSMGVVHSGAQGALVSMTKSLARELAVDGIRVNAVSPGPILTAQEEMFRATAPDVHATELWGPLGIGRPDDIAAAVAFLVRREADHVTGQVLSVNGGRAFAG